MRPVTAVVYGVGTMGSLAVPALLERGVEIVGAVARSPSKIGRDLGIVAGLGRELGVIVRGDARTVLAGTRPDIALLAVNSHLAAHAPHIATCLREGVNVVTLCEEAFFPWWTAPGEAAALDDLARAHGASVLGTGHQDAFWYGLGLQLLGAAGTVESVRWDSLWNPEGGGRELLAAMGIGDPPADAPAAAGSAPDGPPSFAVATVDAVAASLGLGVGDRRTVCEPVLAESATPCASLGRTIPAGHVIGRREVVRRSSPGEPTLTFSMVGRLLAPGEAPGETWTITGAPELRLAATYTSGHVHVLAQAINRIPDVLAARAGWLRHDELPPLRRHPVIRRP